MKSRVFQSEQEFPDSNLPYSRHDHPGMDSNRNFNNLAAGLIGKPLIFNKRFGWLPAGDTFRTLSVQKRG
jgi:hypothetical protein